MAQSRRMQQMMQGIAALANKTVLVGIPAKNNPRPGEPIGNAALGYIHEHGSAAANIPARPFLRPGITAALPAIRAELRQAARAAAAGNSAAVDQHLGNAGQLGADSAKAEIQAGIPPPLRPATVRRRQRRSPGSRYRRAAATPAQVTPLYDTGALLRAITWIIR